MKVPYGSTAENPIEAPWFLWSCIDEDGGQAIQLSKQWSEQMLKNAEVGSASITDWKTTMIDSGTTCSLQWRDLFHSRCGGVNRLSLDVSRNRSRYTYMNSGSYKLLARAVEEACSGGLPPANSPFPSLFTVPRSRRDQALWWYQVSERLLESSQRHQQALISAVLQGIKGWIKASHFPRFPSIKVFFNSVETKWVPEAYLYRLGLNQLCSSDPRGKYKDFYPSKAPPGKARQTPIVMAFKTMGRMPTPSWVPFGCCTRRGALSEVSHEFSLCHFEFRPGDFL